VVVTVSQPRDRDDEVASPRQSTRASGPRIPLAMAKEFDQNPSDHLTPTSPQSHEEHDWLGHPAGFLNNIGHRVP
jgi:hypothetical protein